MSVAWGTLSERASWPASDASLLQTLWKSLASRRQPASAEELQQLATWQEAAIEQLEQTSPDILSSSGIANGLQPASTEELHQLASLQDGAMEQPEQTGPDILSPSNVANGLQPSALQVLLGVDAESHSADRLPRHLSRLSAAADERAQSGDVSRLEARSAAAAVLVPESLEVAASACSAAEELDRLQECENHSALASTRSCKSDGSAGSSSRDTSHVGAAAKAGQQRAPRQSRVRGSKAPRPSVTLPEGNILEFDHGGCERRPGAVQLVTASSCVSDWAGRRS